VIEDFNIVNPEMLTHQILPFLAATEQHHEKVLIHCSGGIGRTGQVLAAWLLGGDFPQHWRLLPSRKPGEILMKQSL
jgi:protein-tyrosine phosphatase